MAAQTPAAASASSPRSKEITRSPDHSDVNKLAGVKRSMETSAAAIEQHEVAKTLPPLEVILVPEFIPRVWYTNRLVPWIEGFVQWDTYVQYLREFLNSNLEDISTLNFDECLTSEKEFAKCYSSLLSEDGIKLRLE